jgi:hypothetical protein
MERQLTSLDYYLSELLQVNRSLKAAQDQLSIAWQQWEVEYLENSISSLKEQKRLLIEWFNHGTLSPKNPK